MAKMFYTLEEAAQRLGMSEDEVQALAESGQLQEFRDRDRLVFKVDQVDLLAGGGDEDADITLAESSELEPISLSSSGSGSAFAVESSGESTGISIFDPDADEQADPSADTLVTGAVNIPDLSMDSSASGSGLAQLTLEPDDTSLGANLLEDVYGDEGSDAGESAIGGSAIAAASGGALFESAGEPEFGGTQAAAQAALMPAQEAYDGPWSGLAGGLALAMVIILAATLGVTILGLAGSSGVLAGLTGSVYMVLGGALVLVLIFAGIGWAALRKS
ncbi:MAG: helix-turn-helix domain-containing protein [Phycisphaerales bacterium]